MAKMNFLPKMNPKRQKSHNSTKNGFRLILNYDFSSSWIEDRKHLIKGKRKFETKLLTLHPLKNKISKY